MTHVPRLARYLRPGDVNLSVPQRHGDMPFTTNPGPPSVQNQTVVSQGSTGGIMGGFGQLMGTNSNTTVGIPGVDPNAFQYGGAPGGAWAAQNAYQVQGQNAFGPGGRNASAPTMQNQYNARDQGAVQNSIRQQGANGQLGQYYHGILNGTAPSLAQAQMNAATDQNIASQMAMAHSAPGSLAGAAAARNAATTGAQMQQNAAQQSMIGRIQEEQQAAAGMQGMLQNQGQLAMGEQGLNANTAYQQAGLQAGQNSLNDQYGLASQQMANQVAQQQLAAQMAGQQLQSQNYLTAQGQAIGQSEANAQQNQKMFGGMMSGLGSMFGDADFQEPGNASNGFTLREEAGSSDHEPFILAFSRDGRVAGKLRVDPLSPSESMQVQKPHGAGPIADPHRISTRVNDLGVTGPDGGGLSVGPAQAAQASQAGWAKGMQSAGQAIQGQDAGSPDVAMPPPMASWIRGPAADLDLRHGRYGDASMLARDNFVEAAAGMSPQQAATALQLGQITYPQYQQAIGMVDQTGAPPPAAPRPPPSGGPTQLAYAPEQSWAAIPGAPQKPADDVNVAPPADPNYVDPEPGKAKPTGPVAQPPGSLVTGAAPAAGPSPGAGTVPMMGGGGGPARTTWQSTMRPDLEQKVEAGMTAEEQAQASAGEAEAAAARDQADIETDKAIASKKREQEIRDDAEAHAAEVKDLLGKRDELSKDLARAHENYGYHPDTGTKVRHAIASALGAWGAALTGTQNFALEKINAEIQRDLDTQAKKIEGKKGRVGDMDTALAAAYRKFGDMDQAKAAAHSAALEHFAAEANAYASMHKSETVRENNAILQAQLKTKNAQTLGGMFKPVTTGGGGGVGAELLKDYKNAQREFDKAALEGKVPQGSRFPSFGEYLATHGGGGGGANVIGQGSGAAAKPNPKGAAIEATLANPTHGEDLYDRLAPSWARSSGSLHNEAELAAQARAYAAAMGRPPPLTMSNREVIEKIIGRSDEASVKDFRKRAKAAGVTISKSATGGGAPEPEEP